MAGFGENAVRVTDRTRPTLTSTSGYKQRIGKSAYFLSHDPGQEWHSGMMGRCVIRQSPAEFLNLIAS